MVDLIADGFDVAFRGGKLEDSSLVARPMGRGKSWLVASPAYLDAAGRPTSPAALETHECVLFRAQSGQDRWALEGTDGATETVTVRGRLSSDEYGFVKSVCLNGGGVGCIPWLLCDQEIASGRLERVLPGWGLPGGQMHLVYPSAQHLPQRVAAFRDFVLEWIKSPPWSPPAD
jgi:DNA-binding transcriptional LysR family regulator